MQETQFSKTSGAVVSVRRYGNYYQIDSYWRLLDKR